MYKRQLKPEHSHLYMAASGQLVGVICISDPLRPEAAAVLNGVHPWSIEHPPLYTLTVQLIRPGSAGLPDRVLDEKTIRFGFRLSLIHI